MPQYALVIVATLLISAIGFSESSAGIMKGTVHDAAGIPAAHVTILVTEHSTGIPVFSDGVPLTQAMNEQRTDLLIAVSGEDGLFEMTVPDGEYRLVAQRWRPPTQPWTSSMGAFDGLSHFGATVELFGVAPNVVVPSRGATELELKPSGSGSVTVLTNPESGNDGTLLIMGTKAPPLDPVFAFYAWQEPFLPNTLAMNRMPYGRTTFHNVPVGEVHLVAVANDNRPGFGAATATVPEVGNVEVVIDLVAGWSNGRHTPPDRLMPLYEKTIAEGWDLMEIPSVRDVLHELDAKGGVGLQDALLREDRKDAKVTLPDGSSHLLKDVVTVWVYLDAWPPGRK